MTPLKNKYNAINVDRHLMELVKLEYAMKKHHTISNPDLTQILETEKETYERLDKEWRNI